MFNFLFFFINFRNNLTTQGVKKRGFLITHCSKQKKKSLKSEKTSLRRSLHCNRIETISN